MTTPTTRTAGKIYETIRKLPDNPEKHIYWIVYNSDMIVYTEALISQIKGEDYLKEHVTVVPVQVMTNKKQDSVVYLDPMLHDHLGNGLT